MMSKARLSPATRGVEGLPERIRRLEAYESWANCSPINIAELVPSALWTKYYALQAQIIEKMREAQSVAADITQQVNAQLAQR
jgi:hypothetical protein